MKAFQEKQYIANSIEDLAAIAEQFVKDFSEYRHFALVGEMGAGKTTFVKALCEYWGVEDAVSSPTFSIVNEYTTANGDTLFHFDLYRIEEEEEALDFGVEEYFESGAYCFLEWANQIQSLLPEDIIEINITEQKGGQRIIIVREYEHF